MGQVASHTRGLASELRQKAAVTVHNTRARLAQRDEIEAETVTFALRFEKNEGTKALAELERSSVTQLERLRALQAEAGPTLLGLVDSAFLNLHQLLDLPMELDGEVRRAARFVTARRPVCAAALQGRSASSAGGRRRSGRACS